MFKYFRFYVQVFPVLVFTSSGICSVLKQLRVIRHCCIVYRAGIYKIKFTGKYKDVRPELSKSQRAILDALELKDSR